jgi:hypothetical protein
MVGYCAQKEATRRWPKFRGEHETPCPRNAKGQACNPNYRIATGTLICVKMPKGAFVRVDRGHSVRR